MKVYRKQIDQAQRAEVQKKEIESRPAPEPKTISPGQEAHIKFMQNIVKNARVRQ